MKRLFRLLIVIFIFIIPMLFIKGIIDSKKPYYLELELSDIKEEFIQLKDIPISPLNQNEVFFTLLYKLYKIKDDNKFKLLILNLSHYNFNFEQTYELRKLIKILKQKRQVICYADSYNQKSYYLATACSKIYMPNGSLIQIPGFYSEILFYRELIDTLRIKIYSIQFEEYKSALEPLINKEPTRFFKEQIEDILNFHYNELKNALIERGIKNPDSLINNLGYFYTSDALKYNLIDGIKYLDEFKEFKKNLKRGKLGDIRDFSTKKIAIVLLEGNILDKDYYNPFVKASTIGRNVVNLLGDIRNDKNVVAVLLRINSPGGSSFISDLIARQIKLLSKEKEVVVSMGRVAASGGYYISAYADKIFAEPFTITGSIGVIFAKVATNEFYKRKLFINPYIIKKGEHADIFASRELTKEEEEGMRNLVYKVYEDFINVVSEGRKISKDSVRAIAKGRIYLGNKAKDIGLVDSIGGLLDALNYLKNKYKDAGIEIYKRHFELNLDLLGIVIKQGFLFYEPIRIEPW